VTKLPLGRTFGLFDEGNESMSSDPSTTIRTGRIIVAVILLLSAPLCGKNKRGRESFFRFQS